MLPMTSLSLMPHGPAAYESVYLHLRLMLSCWLTCVVLLDRRKFLMERELPKLVSLCRFKMIEGIIWRTENEAFLHFYLIICDSLKCCVCLCCRQQQRPTRSGRSTSPVTRCWAFWTWTAGSPTGWGPGRPLGHLWGWTKGCVLCASFKNLE